MGTVPRETWSEVLGRIAAIRALATAAPCAIRVLEELDQEARALADLADRMLAQLDLADWEDDDAEGA